MRLAACPVCASRWPKRSADRGRVAQNGRGGLDPGRQASDPAIDARLEDALRATPNLVLACQLLPDGCGWEDPLPRFRAQAAALGHVHAEPDELDSVGRSLPLEKVADSDRRWALSLEAYRLSRGRNARSWNRPPISTWAAA